MLGIVVCISIVWINNSSVFAETGDYWRSVGAKSCTINLDLSQYTGTVYVAPGSELTFVVNQAYDKDTKYNCSGVKIDEYDDSETQGKLQEIDGTIDWDADDITFGLVSTYEHLSFNVPTDATNGETFTINLWFGDSRTTGDRCDGLTLLKTWNFEISTACPDSMSCESMTDTQNGSWAKPLSGCSYGSYIAVMKANGTPPAGRSNWNGTAVDEEVGVSEESANPSNFKTGVIGIPGTSGGTFVFRNIGTTESPANNKFYDQHSFSCDDVILLSTSDSGVFTDDQKYICQAEIPGDPGVSETAYPFVITSTCTRFPFDDGNPNTPDKEDDKVRVVITK